MRLIASILVLAVAATPAAAFACTVPAGYTPPTNWQLANDANTILLGEVVGGGVGSPADPAASTITVHPIVALKGLLPGADFKIADVRLGDDVAARPADDTLAFAAPDPATLDEACMRRVFAPSTQVLFFLKRENGQWTPAGGPLSRWAQDVSGLDSPWVELASVYAHAAMMPGEDGRQLLEQRHEALVSRSDDPQAAAMAADLERSLADPAVPVIAEVAPAPSDEAATGAQAPAEPSPPDDIAEVKEAIDAFGKN